MNLQQMKVRVRNWLTACFGAEHTNDKSERSFRFAEESVELCQAIGLTRHQMDTILDHVYSRPKGEVDQEAAGTLITLLSVCDLNNVSLESIFKSEMNRAETSLDAIRAKHNTKPAHLAKHIQYHTSDELMDKPKIKKLCLNLSKFFDAPLNFTFHIDVKSNYFGISVVTSASVISVHARSTGKDKPELFLLDSHYTIQKVLSSIEGVELNKTNTEFWVTRITSDPKDLDNNINIASELKLDSIGACLQVIALPYTVECAYGSPIPANNEYLFVFRAKDLFE